MLLQRENGIVEIIAMPKELEFPQKFTIARVKTKMPISVRNVSYTTPLGEPITIKG